MDFIKEYSVMAQQAASMTMLWLVLKALFGGLNCFLGYRLIKVWIACGGVLIGAGIGYLAASHMSKSTAVVWVVTIVAGLVLGALAYEIYLAGVFMIAWFMTAEAAVSLSSKFNISDKTQLVIIIIGVLIGILVGVLSVKFARPALIAITSFSGAVSVSTGIMGAFKQDSGLVMIGVALVLAVLGFYVQWITTERNKK
jgi:F0F1-type ATP synthase assembly protein I